LRAEAKWFAPKAKMVCAKGPKWFAQLAKWFAPHFDNNGRPWENDLRVDLRLICA
jgi:hypothetical protein